MCKIDAVAFGLNWVELGVLAIIIVGVVALFCSLVAYLNHNPTVDRSYYNPDRDEYQPLWESETKTLQPRPKNR